MILYEGFIGETPFDARRLSLQHLPQLEQLQRQVYEALPDKNTLQPLSTEEFENILGGNGILIGLYVDEELIAFRALLDPKEDPEHLGIDCGVEPGQLHRVLYQEISNVSPKWRGYGLQKTMATIVMNEVDLKRFDYACATVKPYNIPSLKDKFAQRFVIKALKLKYGGKLRYVFFKQLKQPFTTFTTEERCSMGDIKAQQRLLKEGYVGTRMERQDDDFIIVYEK